MAEVNYLAILLAALSGFLIGGLWYSPALFANRWMALSGQSEETLKSGSMAMIFGGAFVLNLIAAWALAKFASDMTPMVAALHGLGIGLCFVATSLGVSYLFERRPLGLWLINAGYFVVNFTAMGAIIGWIG